MEELIKEIIDGIGGIDWSPGTYPKSLATFQSTPAGSWTVSENGSINGITEITIRITLWAVDASARSAVKSSVSTAFSAVGFEEQPPTNTEIKLPNEEIAFMASLVFHGYVDKQTYWVYKSIN